MPKFIFCLSGLFLLLPCWGAQAAVPIVFDFQDSPGEGFYDTMALVDPDVPGVMTLGEARRTVLQAAGNHLGSFFQPQYAGEVWRIAARFDPLNGSIAAAAPDSWANGNTFTGGTAGVNYPAVLVNHLSGSEVITGNVIDADFNTNTNFDFNMTGPPTGFQESLFSTAVHELIHGLGFFSDIEQNGAFYDGIPAIFDTFLAQGTTPVASMNNAGRQGALVSNNLFFTGPKATAANPLGAGPVKIHAPSTFEGGTTGSHLDRVAFASSGDLLLPEAPSGFPEQIFVSALDQALLADLGFVLATSSPDVDKDGDVDGADFLIIQRTNPALISAWQAAYGTSPLAAISLAGASTAVPEPSSGVLLCLALGGMALRGERRPRAVCC
jgi:hypothetical protein